MKNIFKKLHLSEEGFSMIELIVTMLISSVVTAAVAGFLSAGMQYYWNAKAETKLQTESQIATLFITELLQESTAYEEISSTDFPSSEVQYAIEVTRGDVVSVVAWVGNQLWYADVDAALSDYEKLEYLLTQGMGKAFLADAITLFNVSPSRREDAMGLLYNGCAKVTFELKVKDKSYNELAIISLRNREKIN